MDRLRAFATSIARVFAWRRIPVEQDKDKEPAGAGELAEPSEVEHHDELAQLSMRRGKLSPRDAALLYRVFPTIFAAHSEMVRNLLRRRNLEKEDVEDLVQEIFFTLYNYLLDHGFRDSLPGTLVTMTKHKHSNYVRTHDRAPSLTCLPTSSTERPRSSFDVEKALTRRELAHQVFYQLSREHQEVIEMVLLNGLTYLEAAEVLGLNEWTLKSRLIAAKRAFAALAEPSMLSSQRP